MATHLICCSVFRSRSRAGCVAGALIAFLLLGAPLSAQAAAVIEAVESGGNVVFTGEGSLNVDEWTNPQPDATDSARVQADQVVIVGPLNVAEVERFLTAPANFDGPFFIGPGLNQTTATGSGDMFGIDFGSGHLIVPRGYVSGELLRSRSTYVGKTFESLGIAVGSYTWTWGSGDTADSLTLVVLGEGDTCEDELDACKELTADEDGDGLYDQFDLCPGTPAGEAIDAAGCSLYQFCDNAGGGKRNLCFFADWQNDEPGGRPPKDCRPHGGTCRPAREGARPDDDWRKRRGGGRGDDDDDDDDNHRRYDHWREHQGRW